MISTHPCHVCGDPVEPGPKTYIATFEGKPREVCEDCGIGIANGVEILARKCGVAGTYLGPCGDNNPPSKD